MDPMVRIVSEAKKNLRTIVFPEGNDSRTWAAARKLVDDGIVRPVILGGREECKAAREEAGVNEDGINLINPASSSKHEEYSTELAALLIEMTPEPLDQVFFADSGSISVEVAIKMALQYWQAKGKTEKQSLLTVRGG